MKIGCIGQGFVGKNIADNYEQRGFEVIRYALEDEYRDNADYLQECDIVFVAVPTPATPNGFDGSTVESVIELVPDGGIAIIKSTVVPGTTSRIQDKYANKIVLFSPEFLCESTAAYDVANPIMNVIGLTSGSAGHRKAAESVMATFPFSEANFIVSAESAEIFKYAHNLNGYFRVILANLLYDVADTLGSDWGEIKSMMDTDVMMSPYYNNPVHKGGRGAGGNCFIKDMAAFRSHYKELVNDDSGLKVFEAMEKKNLELLNATKKDQHIIQVVYGI